MYIYSPALKYHKQWIVIQFSDIVHNYSLKTPLRDGIVKLYCNLLDILSVILLQKWSKVSSTLFDECISYIGLI